MGKGMLPTLWQAKLAAQTAQLQKSNEVSQRYGLMLSETEMKSLIIAQAESLRACGRLEFGDGILPRLIFAFCDSPYIIRDVYYDTLEVLQNLFYLYKNDVYDALSDDELIQAMHKLFHDKAQGSLDYLENIATEDLIRALRSDDTQEDDENV